MSLMQLASPCSLHCWWLCNSLYISCLAQFPMKVHLVGSSNSSSRKHCTLACWLASPVSWKACLLGPCWFEGNKKMPSCWTTKVTSLFLCFFEKRELRCKELVRTDFPWGNKDRDQNTSSHVDMHILSAPQSWKYLKFVYKERSC